MTKAEAGNKLRKAWQKYILNPTKTNYEAKERALRRFNEIETMEFNRKFNGSVMRAKLAKMVRKEKDEKW